MTAKTKSDYQTANFSVTFLKDHFNKLKEESLRTGRGFHRTIKDYLRENLFPYMEVGDYTFIKGVVEQGDSFEVMLHLNKRLLTKALEKGHEKWVVHVYKPLPVGPGECPPGGAERATANAESTWPPLPSR